MKFICCSTKVDAGFAWSPERLFSVISFVINTNLLNIFCFVKLYNDFIMLASGHRYTVFVYPS